MARPRLPERLPDRILVDEKLVQVNPTPRLLIRIAVLAPHDEPTRRYQDHRVQALADLVGRAGADSLGLGEQGGGKKN